MIHIMMNGILVETECITEISMQMKIKKYPIHREVVEPAFSHSRMREDDTLTILMREVLLDILKQRRG